MSKYSKDNENIKGKRMSDWKTVKIGDICEQINGVSYKPADVYDSLNENATVLLRANNIFEDKLNYDELVFVDKKRVSDIQYMKKGDILICASSGSKHLVGKAACLSEDKELTFGAFCKVLRPKTVNPEFIKHYFFSPSYRTEISRLSEGANINNIKAADLDNLTLPLPTESEQKKIAKQLDKCIKIINNQKRSLEKYDLLIKSRFIEMFGDNNFQKKKWNEIFITKTGKLDSNAMVEDGEYPFFTCAKEVFKIDKYAFDQEALLLAGNNAAGKYDVKHYKGKFNAYQRTYVLSLKEEWEYPLFKYQLEDKLEYLRQQSLGGLTKYLTLKILETLDFIVPPIELQKEFSTFVQQIDKSKSAVQKSLEKTETLYKSLMQQYFG